jgi:hypothetical protein
MYGILEVSIVGYFTVPPFCVVSRYRHFVRVICHPKILLNFQSRGENNRSNILIHMKNFLTLLPLKMEIEVPTKL